MTRTPPPPVKPKYPPPRKNLLDPGMHITVKLVQSTYFKTKHANRLYVHRRGKYEFLYKHT